MHWQEGAKSHPYSERESDNILVLFFLSPDMSQHHIALTSKLCKEVQAFSRLLWDPALYQSQRYLLWVFPPASNLLWYRQIPSLLRKLWCLASMPSWLLSCNYSYNLLINVQCTKGCVYKTSVRKCKHREQDRKRGYSLISQTLKLT